MLQQSLSTNSLATACLGFPRIGRHRELKFALEDFWSGKISAQELEATGRALRAEYWNLQKQYGITYIPSNDFSFYDHVLDTTIMVGAIPEIYGWEGGTISLPLYFAMARGQGSKASETSTYLTKEVPALEMTKWFDTNYHYMVPELHQEQKFILTTPKPLTQFLEAKALGIHTRPVILGPISFLKLSKARTSFFNPLDLLERLLPVYAELCAKLQDAGADWVQMDEPVLSLDLTVEEQKAFHRAYATLQEAAPDLKLMLTNYFGSLGNNLTTAASLPTAGLHIDYTRAAHEVLELCKVLPETRVLSLGAINGRNIWRADLATLRNQLQPIIVKRGAENCIIANSCSLLHVPIDLELETGLDPDVKNWLAFACQKLGELAILGSALSPSAPTEDPNNIQIALKEATQAYAQRASSPKAHNPQVKARLSQITPEMQHRKQPFAVRQKHQQKILQLPLFPTTTIGSFPQTADIRKARAQHAKGALSAQDYTEFLRTQTKKAIDWQEEIGLDVLVHGEFERNDMVQYFGEQLAGFAFTKHAWVQSYGSRCVRPPIIYGDVSRPKPMTVEWWRYAQSCTTKPVKGMLTGPVTILNWSFVRDDIPRRETCQQIALAIRDEVCDLEQAGAPIIQIDEAALREGLPLRQQDWPTYLEWAIECFRLCASGVTDKTQIHTHMCYSEFQDILPAIAAMDADVLSIETSRSKMELLDVFCTYQYPNGIGPGVYDIHSPRVPSVADMITLLNLARQRLHDHQLWINPDCGLKTRKWEEVHPALVHMVQTAKALRQQV